MNRLSCAVVLAFAVALATACGPSDGDDDDDVTCEASLLAGDLVITEIQSDLVGADDGKEWFEIYNATGASVRLVGLTLVHAKNDGTGEKTHTMTSGELPAGGYLVVAGLLDEFRASYMDYGYGEDLGTLRNTNGLLALRCGTAEIDRVTYDAVEEGASLSLDGASAPDYLANDDAANWCSSRSSYGSAGELGTPQAANDPCGAVTTCNDGGTPRELDPPAAGDLVITEVMPNPEAATGGDAEGEWFEVYVANTVDLNGLQIGRALDSLETIESADCLSYGAGSYVLFAKTEDSTVNGGLTSVDFTFGFSLANSDSSLVLARGGALLDQVTWTSSSAGASTALDPDFTDPTDNDNAANFCAGTAVYGDGDRGTPRGPNDACVFAGDCVDDGGPRAIARPAPGDLAITEIMADPLTPTDSDGEWFEIYAFAAFDLNGLELGRTAGTTPGTPNMTIDSVSCLPVTTGSYVLFARVGDSGVNGGLPAADQLFNFGLSNTGDQTLFVNTEGTLLDSVTYNGSTAGVSRELDPAVATNPNAPTLNDDSANWCAGAITYGSGGAGTPGATNSPTCP